MPCYDARNEGAYIAAQYAKRIDALTDMLCRLCQRVEGIDPSLIGSDAGLYAWWTEHQRQDMERQRQEQRKRDQEALRNRALAKLTPDEQVALGMKRG
jgi:hypothetical protein